MALDIDALVAPLSEDAPSGPDLCYENDRAKIESAFDRSVSDGAGAERSEKEWRDTIKEIIAQTGLTRDIWLPVYLMRASVLGGQFSQLVEAAEYLARLLEERWADVHPQIDEYGFIGRKTPCESLVSTGNFLLPLGRLALLSHQRLGKYSGEDLVRFRRDGGNAEGHGMFMALLDELTDEAIGEVSGQLASLRDSIARIDTVLTANAEGDTGTNFQPLYELLDGYIGALNTLSGASDGQGDDSAALATEPGIAAYGAMPGGGGALGAINSRDDVIRALDAIGSYYQRHEPSSPVPFALRRAREWISLDFMAVLEDIAPSSVDEANRVLKSGRNGGVQSSQWDAGAAPDEEISSGETQNDAPSDSGW